MKSEHSGAEWVRRTAKVEPSPLGVRVADLLYYLLDGLHHASHTSMHKVDWANPHDMAVSVSVNHLATVDFDGLTRLVFLAHALCVRVELQSSGPHLVKLVFYERQRGNHQWTCHPTLDEAVARFHEQYNFLETAEAVEEAA